VSDSAPSYNVALDFGNESDESSYLTSSAYWVCAIIRLGQPLSYSRELKGSVTKDVGHSTILRAEEPLIITDDLHQITISHTKSSHLGQMSAQLKHTELNYLVEVLPGDWVLCWIVNNQSDYERLITQINDQKPCNDFHDGLKFVGRVHDVRKSFTVAPETGHKSSVYVLTCTSFTELDSMFYYEPLLASTGYENDIGQWLGRLGIAVQGIFGQWTTSGISPNNINLIPRVMLDLIVGKGPPNKKSSSIQIDTPKGQLSQSPQTQTEAPFAYLVPDIVGKLLGRDTSNTSKGIMSYADVIELLQGVQTYSNHDDWHVFIPDLSTDSNPTKRVTTIPLMGTFLPAMPNFANRPLWSVLQQYQNPTLNEMYTTLRVNPEGLVVPTIVFRQIPLTTEAFPEPAKPEPKPSFGVFGGEIGPPEPPTSNEDVRFTRFLSLPRWKIPAVMIQGGDVGRSDTTRQNFVHVFGQSSYQASNVSGSQQIIQNPPLRDDLDIMKHGQRNYAHTVECFVSDTVGKVPAAWTSLIADWTIGSHLMLNGNIHCHGIQSPICVGDAAEFDGVVYMIEGVSHSVHIDGQSGRKKWTTQLALHSGMRAQVSGVNATDTFGFKQPLYPGLLQSDLRQYDPGLTLEQRPTTGGGTTRNNLGDLDKDAVKPVQEDGSTLLDPSLGTAHGRFTPEKV
jgi:hypothetical protein